MLDYPVAQLSSQAFSCWITNLKVQITQYELNTDSIQIQYRLNS